MVNWQKRDPVTRYAILIKVRNKRRVQRFPVTSSPAVCILEPGVEVVAALEGDNASALAWVLPVRAVPVPVYRYTVNGIPVLTVLTVYR